MGLFLFTFTHKRLGTSLQDNTWSIKTTPLVILLQSLQTFTNCSNVWPKAYRVNLQHNNCWLTRLTYVLLLHYLGENFLTSETVHQKTVAVRRSSYCSVNGRSTLAVDGWAVTFGTAKRAWAGPGPLRCTKCNGPPINVEPVYQLCFIPCATIIALGV